MAKKSKSKPSRERALDLRRRPGQREGRCGAATGCACRAKVEDVDYKDEPAAPVHLRAREDPLAAHHEAPAGIRQNQVSVAVKRAREMALLPYVGERQ